MKRPLLALAACLLIAGAADPAAAQMREIDSVVAAQLDSAAVLLRAGGFELHGAVLSGYLARNAEAHLSLKLEGGREYMIMAVCDVDCDGLNLLLTDASGAEVASDYEPDDVPIVTATVAAAASFELTVQMASCSIEPCGYGVAVFASPR